MSSLGVQSPRMKPRQLLLSATAHSTAHDPLCSTQIVTAVLIRSPLESIRTPNPNGGKQKRPNASRAAPRSNSSSLHDWLSWSVLPRLARLQLRPLPRRQNQIRWDSPPTRLHLPGGRLALPMSPAVVHIIVSFCSNIHLPGHQWDVQSWVLLQISRKKAKNAAKRSNWPRKKVCFVPALAKIKCAEWPTNCPGFPKCWPKLHDEPEMKAGFIWKRRSNTVKLGGNLISTFRLQAGNLNISQPLFQPVKFKAWRPNCPKVWSSKSLLGHWQLSRRRSCSIMFTPKPLLLFTVWKSRNDMEWLPTSSQ